MKPKKKQTPPPQAIPAPVAPLNLFVPPYGDPDDVEYRAINKMSRDLLKMSAGMTRLEARALVKTYYRWQDQRMRSGRQADTMKANPTDKNEVLFWFVANASTLETQAAGALDVWSAHHPVGQWMRQHTGVGPVIAAALLAMLDIKTAPTTGHWWRFAGLDPTLKWHGREAATDIYNQVVGHPNPTESDLEKVAEYLTLKPDALRKRMLDFDGKYSLTKKTLTNAIAKCPWNQLLKKTCWKLGESFVKQSSRETCWYGKKYLERKAFEWTRNFSGGNTEAAAKALQEKDYSKGDSNAKSWYTGKVDLEWAKGIVAAHEPFPVTVQKGESHPMLPPAQIHLRATRWTVKLFLAHLHDEWYRWEFKQEPPLPYPIAHQGHAHFINPPGQSIPEKPDQKAA